MPSSPRPTAVAHLWRWAELLPIAERSGELMPVGRGGERRAIALANPALGGMPFATPTLWAAIQYLGPREVAPSHRHTQGAFRFVVDGEGEGVWTNVDGDAVAMRRGDLLLTPSWAFHEHQNVTDRPMSWLDGLDIPLVNKLDARFSSSDPTSSRPARPRLAPAGSARGRTRACVRSAGPARRTCRRPPTGGSTLTRRCPPSSNSRMRACRARWSPATRGALLQPHQGRGRTGDHAHRDAPAAPWRDHGTGAQGRIRGMAGLRGRGRGHGGGEVFGSGKGDLFVVPSWNEATITARGSVDLFRFSDKPVYEALGLARTSRGAHA